MRTRRTDSLPRDPAAVKDVENEDKANNKTVIMKSTDVRKLKSESLPPPTPHRRMSQEINEYVLKMSNIMSDLEYEIVGSALLTPSLDEKKSQLDRARRLRSKVKEVRDAYESIMLRLDDAKGKVLDVIEFNDRAYRDHLLLKECSSEFSTWIRSVREKVPSLTEGNLSDRLGLESSLLTFSQIKDDHLSYGKELLDKLKSTAASAKETSSADGKILIQNNVDNLDRDFTDLFSGIEKTMNELTQTQIELKSFKEEFEKVNEWLVGMDQEIRNERSDCRAGSLAEKQNNVSNIQQIMDEFTHFKETSIKQLGRKEFLLKSHLGAYARSQLMIVDSRFQVLMNLLTEVMAKVTAIHDQHHQFRERCEAANSYIHVSIEMLNDLRIDEGTTGERITRDELQTSLVFCQDLQKRNQEEGQPLIYQTLDAGSKALASTYGDDSREDLEREIQDVKNQWDKFILHVQGVMEKITSAISKAQDHEVKLSKLVQSLEEHEKRLDEIRSRPEDPITLPVDQVSKGKLRKLDSLLQEVLTYESIVISSLDENEETRIRYNDLVDDVKQELKEAHSLYDILDDASTAVKSLESWMGETSALLKEYSSTVQESDKSSMTHWTELVDQLQQQGRQKMDLCLRLCESAGSRMQSDDLSTFIDKIQADYDRVSQEIGSFCELLQSQSQRWQEYEDEVQECRDFLDRMDALVQEFRNKEPDLLKKRSRLEEFQQKHLQSIFEQESKFLQLNQHHAQSLEEIETLCTRYSNLVITGRQLIHELEQKYQEHQQLNQLLLEANEFLEQANEKIELYQERIYSNSTDDLNTNVTSLKSLISTVSSSNDLKVSYIREISARVITSTHESGIEMIRDAVAHIVKEYDCLLQELKDILQEYEDRVTFIQDLRTEKRHSHHEQDEEEEEEDENEQEEEDQEPLQFYPKWSYVLHSCQMTPVKNDA